MTVLRRLGQGNGSDAGGEDGSVPRRSRRQVVVAATAVVVSMAVGAGGVLLLTRGSEGASAPTTSLGSKGATIDTTTTSTTTTTTPLEVYTAVPDPNAPPDVNLDAAATTLPEVPGEPFIAEAPPTPSALTVSAVEPSSGDVGSSVRLVGTGLDRVTSVSFNGVDVDTFTALSSTEIVTAVPDGATSGSIRLANDRGDSVGSLSFSVTSPAVIGLSSQLGPPQPTGSARFDGTAVSYLNVPGSTDWAIGTRDFTVEWFQYQTPSGSSYPRVFTLGNYPSAKLQVNNDNGVIKVWTDGTARISYTPPNYSYYFHRWVHFAIARSGGVLGLYIDGIRVASVANNTDIQPGTQTMLIGSEATASQFGGYLSNFHFVTGTALYTGDSLTIPTMPITPVPDTKLLLRFASAADFLVDSSPSRKTITTVGTVAYGVAPAIGTSPEFDALKFDGDQKTYLSVAPSADWNVGKGDFTVEWFQHQFASPCCPRIFTLGTYPSSDLGFSIDNGVMRAWVEGGRYFDYQPPASAFFNKWTHIAVVRSAGVLSLYVDGIRRGSVANTTDIQTTQPLMIGAELSDTSTMSHYDGYLSNFHFVNGTALYTGASLRVPTASIAPVANTKLLLRATSGPDAVTDVSSARRAVSNNGATYAVTAQIGALVTIKGTNLQTASSVSFGGVETVALSASATSVTAVVPPGAVSGPVTVRTADSSSTSAVRLTVTTPVIKELSPAKGAPGTVVTINGANLRTASTVLFGGVSASFTVVSDTRLTATVPSSGLTGRVAVITPFGTAVSGGDFVLPPRLTSFDVTRQDPGKTVVLTGVNLAETTAVLFSSSEQLADFTVLSATQLRITVPDDASTGGITVANAAGSATSGSFTISPVINELVPSSGPAGTVVYIRGSGLTGTASVKYGATSVSFTVLSSREISFTVPAAATSQSVYVGSLVTGLPFTVAAPPAVVLAGTSPAPTVTAPTASGGTTATAASLVGASSVALGGGLSMSLTSSSLVGGQLQGTGTASLGSFQFPAFLTYTSAGNWSVVAATAISLGKFRVNSTDVSVSSWSGSIVATGGSTAWSLSGRVVSSSALVASKVVIAGADVRPVPTCPDFATSAMCASAPTAYVRVEAASTVTDTTTSGTVTVWAATAQGLEVNLGYGMPSMSPSNRTLVPFRAVLNPVSGAFVLNATFGNSTTATLGGTRSVTMRSMRLTMGNGDASARIGGSSAVRPTGQLGGFDVLVTGGGQIGLPGFGSWTVTNVGSVFTDTGVAVVGDFSGSARVADSSVSSFGYVRMATSVTINGTVVQVPANTFVLSGTIMSPLFLRRLGVDHTLLNTYVVYTENSGVIKEYASLPIGVTLPEIPGVRVSIDSITLGIEIPLDPKLANLIMSLSGQGTITPTGRNPIAITIEGRYDLFEASTTVALSAASPNGEAIWENVLGVSDFDLNSVAIQIGVSEEFPYVSVGLMGKGDVPQALRGYMGLDNRSVPISFAANLSLQHPCLEVGIGTKGSTDSIIAVPPGMDILTAGYALVRASYDGCRVGTMAANTEIDPGIEVSAAGSLLGNPVKFYAKYDPTPVGPFNTPTYQAWTDVSMKSLPGLALDATYRYSESAGGWTLLPKISIRGGIALGSNGRIALFGSCELRVTGPRCDQSGSGAVSIAGFKMYMDLSVTGWATPNVVYSGSAGIRVGGVRLTLAGTFGTTGVLESSSMDNPGLIYAFSASGKFPGTLVDSFDISIAKTAGTTVLPSGKLSVRGSVGGVFAQSAGTTRWGGSTTFTPSMANVTIPANFTIPIGAVNVPVKLKMRLCLTGTCAGTVVPSLDVNFTFLRQPISLSDIPVDPTTWDFAYRLQKSISKSGQAGSSWGGIKGTVTSAIDFSISTTNISLNSTSASAKAYIGLGGSWNYVGTVGASFNGSTGEYCFSASGKKLCL